VQFPWAESRQAYADATRWFLDTVALVGDRWEAPGLGEWDVRSLVGHTTRALLTVETYLGRPAAEVAVDSAAGYFRAGRSAATSADVAARGLEAGQALGSDPVAAVDEVAARVLRLLDDRDGSEIVSTLVGGIRLGDYLPTRTFELTVHTADLATALELPQDVPASAATQSLRIVADLAVADDRSAALLLGATGRAGLPAGFSVL
jgi:uncharacterized protein (TIGR03083 family)